MTASRPDDIAIVGMSCLFPGAPDLASYWANITGKIDSISDPHSGWDTRSAKNNLWGNGPDPLYTKRGGYLGELARFDPLKFGIMPNCVDGSEPEHFLGLQLAEAALRDAGVPNIPLNRDRTQVVIGLGTHANRALASLNQHGYVLNQFVDLIQELRPDLAKEDLNAIADALKQSLPNLDSDTTPGAVSSITSGRIANKLDLMGVNYCVDAACASSLIAMEHCVNDLMNGRCDSAIVGGIQLSANVMVFRMFCELEALSRNSSIKPMSRLADGTLLGEGVGMVVLKRLADAHRDGNRIYAVVRSVASSSDGKAKSVLAPRMEGQLLALERAYAACGVEPSSINLLELHGTSMPLGDATELETINRFYGKGGAVPNCSIGSVKSMIGHLIPAAGIAGVIKTALSLYHKILPPTLHAEEPLDALWAEDSRFYLNSEVRPWIHGPDSHPRRAAVNAFGFGGVNAHIILEENDDPKAIKKYDEQWKTELCVFSAPSRQALVQKLQLVEAFLEQAHEIRLSDVAYTACCGEELEAVRVSLVVDSVSDLINRIRSAIIKLSDPKCERIRTRTSTFFFEKSLAAEGKVAFVFPGEGSQYTNMLADLVPLFPAFQETFDLADRAFLHDGVDVLLSDVVYPPANVRPELAEELSAKLWTMEYGVQAITAANRALFRFFRSLKCDPDAVVGHSSGEFGALEASGILPTENVASLIRLVSLGKQTVREVSNLAEGLDSCLLLAAGTDDPKKVYDSVEEFEGEICVAMDNCPFQMVLCGQDEPMQRLKEKLLTRGVSCNVLPFHRPYHTAAFKPVTGPLESYLQELEVRAPKIPTYSCCSTERFPDDPATIRNLALEQWSEPVRFRETIGKMYEEGFRIFVEMGPGSNLSSFIGDTLNGKEVITVPTNTQRKSGLWQLQSAIALLVAQGVKLSLTPLFDGRTLKVLDFSNPKDYKAREQAPRLKLEMPVMQLPPKLVAQLKQPEAKVNGPVPHASIENSAPPSEARSQSPKATILHEHFQTMNRFLEDQEAIFRKLTGTRGETGRLNVATEKPSQPSRRFPFVGVLQENLSDSHCRVTHRQLDIQRDLYIKDHTLGGTVSNLDRELTALPVNPLTMSLEMLAQEAAVLLPGKVLVRMSSVQAYRWVVAEHGTIHLECEVRQLDENRAHAILRDLGTTDNNGKYVELDLEFAPNYSVGAGTLPTSFSNGKPSRFTSENMYREGMFSGPSFQGVVAIDQWSPEGLSGELVALPDNSLFSFEASPDWVSDPVLLDAASQLLAHWNAESANSGFNMFPYGIKGVEFFGASVRAPERVKGRIVVNKLDVNRYSMDVELFREDGSLHMRVLEWAVVSMALPETFWGMLHASTEISLGEPMPALMADAPAQGNMEARVVRQLRRELLLGYGRIWLRALAPRLLSRRELATWHKLDYGPDRKIEWLLGRAAAKDAVRNLLKRLHHLELCPADIEIIPDESGCPRVAGTVLDFAPNPLYVSIAHKGDVAFAVAREGLPIGADLEELSNLPKNIYTAAFSDDEMDLLQKLESISGDTRPWSRCFWSAKESAGKFLGVGLLGDPRNFRISQVLSERPIKLLVSPNGELANKVPTVRNSNWIVRLAFVHDHIFAICLEE